MIRFHCPDCRGSSMVPDAMAGKKMVCPVCGRPGRVPGRNIGQVVLAAIGAVGILSVLALILHRMPAQKGDTETPTAPQLTAENPDGAAKPDEHKTAEPRKVPAPAGSEPKPSVSRGANKRPTGNDPEPSAITATTRWKFSEGSGGFNITPHTWTTTLTLTSNDDATWVVVPDLLVGESTPDSCLATAICPEDLQEVREACTPYKVCVGPSDATGRVGVTLFVRAADGGGSLISMSYAAHWKFNRSERPWQATDMRKGDTLECEWQSLSTSTFKPAARSQPGYRLFHLGPILYRKDVPRGPAYMLIAEAASAGDGNEWRNSTQRFIPLTTEALRKEIDDRTCPIAFRIHCVAMLWHQTCPVTDADKVLMEVLQEPRDYRALLQASAARGLIERRCAAATTVILSLARNRAEDQALRQTITGGLHLLPDGQGIPVLATIVRDTRESEDLRKTALRSLSKAGPDGRRVVQELRGDAVLGKMAELLLR